MKKSFTMWLIGFVISVVGCSSSRPANPDSGIIPCMTEKNCPAGMYCNDGICDFYKDGSSGCRSDADCPPGKRCEVLTGRCVEVADGGEEPADVDGADGGLDGGGDAECQEGEIRECGPATIVGECDIGVEHCVGGHWSGVCQGAVWPEDEKCDGKDNDCDGETPLSEQDLDSDGYWPCQGDCDDADAAVGPGKPEIYCNQKDDDCNPQTLDDPDGDGDGFSVCHGDCNDSNSEANPGRTEIPCNGLDDDCNSATSDGPDNDGDGVSGCGGDCDDNDAHRFPGNQEISCNGIDDDCNSNTLDDPNPADNDQDSYTVGCGGDCNDNNSLINPGVLEIECNGVNDDCNNSTYDDTNPTDADGDGYTRGCGGDCNDTNQTIHPGAQEVNCDLIDNDCNPQTPDDANPTDADGDGYTIGCGGDCNDNSAAVNPGRQEIQCNGIDDDCRQNTRDDPEPTDADNDGYTVGCGQDCNDSNAAVNPGRQEVQCNSINDDCNSQTPDDPNPADADHDGYTVGCGQDCNDNNASVNPGRQEVQCNGLDDDCRSNTVDDPNPVDNDHDNYTAGCGDCNDSDYYVNPGRAEIQCNGKNDDCNVATVDDPNPTDSDSDGYTRGCGADCNDADNAVHPNAPELCDAKDNDCDARTDYDDFGGVCQIGQNCQTGLDPQIERCALGLYCQNNLADGRNLCTHWCNNSHEIPGQSDGAHECPLGFKCELYSNTDSAGFCWPLQPGNPGFDVGAACSANSECRSEWCLNNRCTSGCSSAIDCSYVSGWSCVLSDITSPNGNMYHGLCRQAPGSGNTGTVCTANTQCRDGFCDFWAGSYGECENFCCTVNDCPGQYYCAVWLGRDASLIKACDWIGTRGSKTFGQGCSANSECQSVFCLAGTCNSLCCRDTDCPGGYKCDFAFSVDRGTYGTALGRACVPR